MERGPTLNNTRIMRTAGWLAVASLLAAALVGPAATLAVAGPAVTPIEHSGNITTCPAGTTIFINGPTGNTTLDSGGAGGVTVNVTYTNGQTMVAFTVAGGVVNVAYIKGGPNYNEYNYGAAGTTGDTGLISPDNGGGEIPIVSHSVFCVTPTTTTTSTTSTESTSSTTSTESTSSTTSTESTSSTTSTGTTSTTSTGTTTTGTTSTATTDTTSTGTTSTGTTSSGTVEGVTGTPELTPPSTDTVSVTGGSSPASGTLQLLLVAMAGLLAGVLLLTPGTARKR
jgi:hypothetical protein